jgi:DNA-binding NarL/FixJ family response regulator
MPNLMTRPQALKLVQTLTRTEKLIAWAMTWGWEQSDICTCLELDEQTVRNHVREISSKFGLPIHGFAIVLILAEGVRPPDLADFPGVHCEPIWPQEPKNAG